MGFGKAGLDAVWDEDCLGCLERGGGGGGGFGTELILLPNNRRQRQCRSDLRECDEIVCTGSA